MAGTVSGRLQGLAPSQCGWLARQAAWPPAIAAAAGRRAAAANVQQVPVIPCGAAAPARIAAAPRCLRGAAAAAAAAAAPAAAAAGSQAPEDADEARLYALYDFVAAHGRPPAVQEAHRGVAVGRWGEQCRQLRAGGALPAALAAALESVPGWSWQPHAHQLAQALQAAVQQLAAFQAAHGRLPKLRVHKSSGSSSSGSSSAAGAEADADAYLDVHDSSSGGGGGSSEAAATSACRRLYEMRRRGVLTRQQMADVCEALPGWRWDSRVRAPPLDETLQLLHGFAATHGRLPRQHERHAPAAPFQLGEWCTERRSEYARGTLESDVADAIAASTPAWSWNLVDAAFSARLEVLRSFVAQHARLPAQREAHGGVRIGAWCNKRRLQHRQGQLPADRAALLEAVDGWWWEAEDVYGGGHG